MGKDNELDDASRKRLEKLNPNWNDSLEACSLEKLTLADLRLLLERHAPLQDLIRTIAVAPTGKFPSALAQETSVLREQNTEATCSHETVHAQLAKSSAELSTAQQTINALRQELAQCTSTSRKLLDEKQSLEQARAKLEKQLQQLQQQLNDTQAILAKSGQVPIELRLLRQDAELAQQLGLANLPADDIAALIQVVAVLAQRDNLERLWILLKERCETGSRKANSDEVGLLKASLVWYNHNWQSRPYQLISATERGSYDYERQLRSRHSTGGDTITELRLPGIADGSNKPLCKALVITK
jgi:chromosome segregation ATPase